jgi:hypothetical protein
MSHFIVEQWKEFVPEFETVRRYKISNLGRIKSFDKNLEDQRLLKGARNDGYPYLVLNGKKDGESVRKSVSIHYLIGLLFIPKESEDKKHVIHLDYCRTNNVITNLQWATYDEMIAHGKKSPHVISGRKRAFEKFGPKNTKLSEIDVIRLKRKLLDPNRKTRLKILAKQFGVTEMQLHRIKTGENWGHIKV